MMMWFFIVSDALTFSGFLAAYGLTRFKFIDSWPIADEVFTHIPFIHGTVPMYYVAFMTFVLIFSSVTMVMAVDAGHQMQQKKVAWYMFATIIGGLIFVGSQAWEWNTFIKGSYGAVKTTDGKILQFVKDGHQIALSDFVVGERMDVENNIEKMVYGLKMENLFLNILLHKLRLLIKLIQNSIRIEQIDLDKKQKIILQEKKGATELAKAK